MSIPRNYKVLFMQGGASAQFSLVPMNLGARRSPRSTTSTPATGRSRRSPRRSAIARCTSPADAGGDYTRVPPQSELRFSAGAAYVHYTPNETISGVEFGYVPRHRRRAAGGRHVVEHFVAAHRGRRSSD